MTWLRPLRWIAVAIAGAGVIDPAFTATRAITPEVALIDAGDTDLADVVAGVLEPGFVVIRGAYAGAAATVIAGARVPADAATLDAPGFAVTPLTPRPLAITAIDTPERVSPRAQVPVRVTLAAGEAGPVEVALIQSDIVTDRVAAEIPAGEGHVLTLGFVPATEGPSSVRIRATRDDVVVEADVPIDVVAEPWRILFYDPRPSWMSTFLRRALEADSRFSVTSRVRTSRDVSVNVGGAPSRISSLADIQSFDVVVAGAATALTGADWGGLEAFARERGGTVVVPLDTADASTALDRMADVRGWQALSAPGPLAVSPAGMPERNMTATELAWPVELPAFARTIASSRTDEASVAAVVWSAPLGAGQVIVSGALDGWRYRARDDDAFDDFWRQTVAAAASRALPPVSISPRALLLMPGERRAVAIVLRDVALRDDRDGVTSEQPATARVTAWMSPAGDGGAGTRVPVRLEGPPGSLIAELIAPSAPGVYRLQIEAGGDNAEAAVVVREDVRRPLFDSRDALEAWTASRDGVVLSAEDVDALPAAILEAIDVPSRPESWHPMRSGWWIVPFGLALGFEWWLRRRRGLA